MTGVLLEDCQRQMQRVRNRLVPVAVWRNRKKIINVEVAGSNAGEWLDKDNEYLAAQAENWEKLIVRDAAEHYCSGTLQQQKKIYSNLNF